MATTEAQALLKRILEEAPTLTVEMRLIGNGDMVCVINKYYYIWSEEDWEKYRS